MLATAEQVLVELPIISFPFEALKEGLEDLNFSEQFGGLLVWLSLPLHPILLQNLSPLSAASLKTRPGPFLGTRSPPKALLPEYSPMYIRLVNISAMTIVYGNRHYLLKKF